jgi:hypothetical protein
MLDSFPDNGNPSQTDLNRAADYLAKHHPLEGGGRIIDVVWAAMPDCRGDCPLGLDTGLAQVQLGHAWHYKKYQTPADQVRHADAEDETRANRENLWRDSASMAPWDWRKARRK